MAKKSRAKQKNVTPNNQSREQKITQAVAEIKEKLGEPTSSVVDNAKEATENPDYDKYWRTNDLSGYWALVRKFHETLNGDRRTLETDKERFTNQYKEYEEKKELNDQKEVALNQREKDIVQRELALTTGDYSTSIKSLLSSLKSCEEEILDDTRIAIESMKNQAEQLKQERLALEEAKRTLAEKENALQVRELELEVNEERQGSDYESRMTKERITFQTEKQLMNNKIGILEKEKEIYKNYYDNMLSAIAVCGGDLESYKPDDIINAFLTTWNDNKNLREQLKEAPSQKDLQEKNQEIEILTQDIQTLNEKLNDAKLVEAQVKLNSFELAQRDMQIAKDEVIAWKGRAMQLDQELQSMASTIEKLTEQGESAKQAFEFVQEVNKSQKFEQRPNFNLPANDFTLRQFAQEMQQRMAQVQNEDAGVTFCYDLQTIRCFIAGLNMSRLTILQGISGTGKSSLPRVFAKALTPVLGNGPDYSYRICAIQSGWRDSSDLLGYYNSFDKKYKETEFFKALYLANRPEYKDTMFFIILDEMNLSRPEHYFADFLSMMEKPESEHFITINAPEEALGSNFPGGSISVPRNIRFIGTANHDETTVNFAPKTYDRANIIEMPKNIHVFRPRKISTKDFSYSWLNDKFREAEETVDVTRAIEFINNKELIDIIKDKEMSFGNRFEKQLRKFSAVYIATGADVQFKASLAEAVDFMITMKVMRRLEVLDHNKNELDDFATKYTDLFTQTFDGEMPEKALSKIEELKKGRD